MMTFFNQKDYSAKTTGSNEDLGEDLLHALNKT